MGFLPNVCVDEQGFPCAKTSPPKSPEKTVDVSPEEETNFGPEYFRNQEFYGRGRGRGRGGKSRGFHKHTSEKYDFFFNINNLLSVGPDQSYKFGP